MPNEAAMLEVELSVDYPGKPGALRDVAFRLHRGEMLGLVGESGRVRARSRWRCWGCFAGRVAGLRGE